ncbi:Tautomerase/MIF superfamily [Podospora australis]|uniref:L-dopachrome isomerase n=1 Tax=Podospora australis TaxID=1536484 RepID=A0AAN6WYF6_9PEZI|nr:Tautomerase/MIF superfamily [Podospora australis]
MMSRPAPPGAIDQPAIPIANPSRATTSQGNLTFAERKPQNGDHSAPYIVEGDRHMRNIERPPPGDNGRRGRKTQSKQDLNKQRSNISFFEDAFLNDGAAARERIQGDAIVMAEVKTNVIISDEFTFITELSYHLSTRYQRPVSSIVVTLHHGACMFFGGSFDPAYVMSIFALPSQLLPTTNKRNAALIQKHMEEAIGVLPARGFLRFVPTKEEHLACNGKTTAGEIDELEKSMLGALGVDEDDMQGTISKGGKTRKKLGVRSFANLRSSSGAAYPAAELTPPASADETLPTVLETSKILKTLETNIEPQQQKVARKKKSFVATIFGRSGGKNTEYRSSLPPIAAE